MKLKIPLFFLLSLALTACSSASKPTALPTVVLADGNQVQNTPQSAMSSGGGGGAAASGTVLPAREAQMAFTLGGILKVVNFAEGDQVKAGQVLAELDNASIQMEVDQADRNLKELTSPAAAAAAAQVVAAAQKTLNDAQDKADGLFFPRASDTLIDNTQGEIDLAKQALARASDSYRLVARQPDGDTKKSLALVAMTSAQLKLNALIAKYNWYTGKPDDIDAAMARATLDAAKAALQEAEWYLAILKGEPVPPEATGSNLARLEAAKSSLAVSQEKLAHSRLVSPISGTIVSVNGVAGEMVSPGEILFVISDVNHLHVETTDLSERDVPRVSVGQAVSISIKALNTTMTGRVSSISPVANTLGGDVVYKTTIELDSPPEGLRAGMSVDVQFGE